jgi:tetratricopeptide (TPR) repeat protein
LKIFERLESFHTPNMVYRNPQTLIEILNNVACCHRRINSLDYAMEVLKRALSIAKANDLNSGVTYTNLSAVYSQKKLTQKALKISQQAISELYPLMLQDKSPQNIKLLAIAYYNLAN